LRAFEAINYQTQRVVAGFACRSREQPQLRIDDGTDQVGAKVQALPQPSDKGTVPRESSMIDLILDRKAHPSISKNRLGILKS